MSFHVCLLYIYHRCDDAFRAQKRALYPLELKLQEVGSFLVWVPAGREDQTQILCKSSKYS